MARNNDQRSIRHHYIPDALVRRFADENGKIWVRERRALGQAFSILKNEEPRNSSRAFYEKELYTIYDDLGLPSDEIERRYFGDVDDAFGKILSSIYGIIDGGGFPVFGKETADTIRKLVLIFYKRNPSTLKDTATRFDFASKRSEIIERLREEYPEKNEELERIREEPISDEYIQNVLMDGVQRPLEQSLQEIRRFDVSWVGCDPRSGFVLGDRGCFLLGGGILKSDFILFPLGAKGGAILHRHPKNFPNIFSSHDTRRLNELIVGQSLKIGTASKKQLDSLTRWKE